MPLQIYKNNLFQSTIIHYFLELIYFPLYFTFTNDKRGEALPPLPESHVIAATEHMSFIDIRISLYINR